MEIKEYVIGLVSFSIMTTVYGKLFHRVLSSPSLYPFHATDLFWYSLKTLENLWFSKEKGVSKEIRGMKWVNFD